jgi:hypothetical protein
VTAGQIVSAAETQGALETALLATLTARLMKMRHAEGSVPILVYIWRLYVQARNLAVLHHAGDLEPRVVERELVR